MAKFDNWFLTPIQGFTQSKIEKAIRCIVRPLPQEMLLVHLWTEEAVGSHSSLANQWGCEIDMMDYERNKEPGNHWLHRIMAGGARAIWKLRWGAECVFFIGLILLISHRDMVERRRGKEILLQLYCCRRWGNIGVENNISNWRV